MKRMLRAAVALIFAGLPAALPAKAAVFEGVVEYDWVRPEPEPVTHTAFARLYVGHMRSRWEMGGSEGFAHLMDLNQNKSYFVLDPLHLYIDLNTTSEEDQKEQEIPEIKVEKTGKSDLILGYLCEEVVVEAKGNTTLRFWVAPELPVEAFQGSRQEVRFSKQYREAFKKVLGRPSLMLRMQMPEGGQLRTMQAVRIQKKKLDEDLMRIPENYSRTTWAALLLCAPKVKKEAEEAGKKLEFISAADCLKKGAKEAGKNALKNMFFNALGF